MFSQITGYSQRPFIKGITQIQSHHWLFLETIHQRESHKFGHITGCSRRSFTKENHTSSATSLVVLRDHSQKGSTHVRPHHWLFQEIIHKRESHKFGHITSCSQRPFTKGNHTSLATSLIVLGDHSPTGNHTSSVTSLVVLGDHSPKGITQVQPHYWLF